jgi:glycosyltransferase involved in cell wall biosynthesis
MRLYRQADLFAIPTRGDCLPQALAEAAAAGLPLVATATGAVSEIVHDGRNGFLVPPHAPSDLRRALRRLVAEPRLRRAMGQESLALAERDHDAWANNRRIFELMAEVAGITLPSQAGRGGGLRSEWRDATA